MPSESESTEPVTMPQPKAIPMHLTEAEYFARCRALSMQDAMERLTEAIGADDRADGPGVRRHLQIARDAILDGQARLAEHEGSK